MQLEQFDCFEIPTNSLEIVVAHVLLPVSVHT
jgi:hypothetical protein